MTGFEQTVYDFTETVLSILPNSPFDFLQNYSNSPIGEWLGWVNWFIPINTFVVILSTWCSCILVYYALQIVLRWAKAIE